MVHISVHDARNNLSRLIKDAQAGEDVVISSHGRPVARLIPVVARSSSLGAWLLANPPAEGRSPADIDRDLEVERASWE